MQQRIAGTKWLHFMSSICGRCCQAIFRLLIYKWSVVLSFIISLGYLESHGLKYTQWHLLWNLFFFFKFIFLIGALFYGVQRLLLYFGQFGYSTTGPFKICCLLQITFQIRCIQWLFLRSYCLRSLFDSLILTFTWCFK